jgi:hypothetical protein
MSADLCGSSWAPRVLRRPFPTIVLGLATVLGVGLWGSLGTALPAEAAPGPGADLSVTSPPNPIPATPGTVVTTTLMVGNLGSGPLDVNIITRSVLLLDNGKTRLVAGPDPRFAGRINIVPNTLSLPARQERTVQVSVNMPRGLRPDDYFLGFLVSPVINAPSVSVVNDIGGLVVLDVPGTRNRKLTAHYVGLPRFNISFSASASGIVRAKSVGTSTLQFSTTDEISGWPSPKPSYLMVPAHLLPPGLTRDLPVHVSSWLGLGWYAFHTTLVYDVTDRTTGEVALSRTVIVVNPLWFLVIPVAIGLWTWRRRRRRKARQRGLHRAGRHSPARAENRRREPVPVG